MKIRNACVMLSVMALLGACQASGGGSGGDGEPLPPSDIVAPEAGGGGIVALTAKKANSLSISWSAATDAVTAGALLEYTVYTSTGNNITSLSDAAANGILALAWTANATNTVITGLSPKIDYYISVFVRDEAGNSTPYSTLKEKTLSAVTITWCSLQWPTTFSASTTTSTSVYGQYYAVGYTDTSTASPVVVAQCGWYLSSATRASAQYVNATFGNPVGNNHEYTASLSIPSAGTYNYFFRFSGDNGSTWQYSYNHGYADGTATIAP